MRRSMDWATRAMAAWMLVLSACAGASDATPDGAVEDSDPSDAGREVEAASFPQFPVATLTACDGALLDLASPPAPATWLVLTAGDCPSCKDQLPFVATFFARWAPRGVRVVVVLGDDAEGSGHVTPAYCQAFRADFGLPCPVTRDDGFASLSAFAGTATPVQLVLDANLAVRATAAGWDEDFHPGWIERQVRALVEGPP